MAKAFLGIGSNIEPDTNIKKALQSLSGHVRINKISTVYINPAEGRPEQPCFYNCVAEIETQIPPFELKFDVLRPIEESLGRKRTEDKYAARTIDLDLLLYDDMIIKNDRLTIPDPQIEQRAFVALPLQELAPGLKLPGSKLSIAEIAAALDQSGIEPLKKYTEMLRKEIFCRHGHAES